MANRPSELTGGNVSALLEGLIREHWGATVEETADGAVVHGTDLCGGTVNSHGDHRVAMAFAVAGTVAKWPVRIDDTDSVATSFPGFAECLRGLGIKIDTHNEAAAP